ncbi:Hypothetical predicted protein [Olea europaea subsp. europaea]|uniref:Uncharacterized protein n=1 Tax=Olea europaea subsp. europaea TaxID=158383 RepID=A0A8S0TKA5_OLEEU|nr:Hypothetical predicted protein [Olea europaea subsp. europaea]
MASGVARPERDRELNWAAEQQIGKISLAEVTLIESPLEFIQHQEVLAGGGDPTEPAQAGGPAPAQTTTTTTITTIQARQRQGRASEPAAAHKTPLGDGFVCTRAGLVFGPHSSEELQACRLNLRPFGSGARACRVPNRWAQVASGGRRSPRLGPLRAGRARCLRAGRTSRPLGKQTRSNSQTGETNNNDPASSDLLAGARDLCMRARMGPARWWLKTRSHACRWRPGSQTGRTSVRVSLNLGGPMAIMIIIVGHAPPPPLSEWNRTRSAFATKCGPREGGAICRRELKKLNCRPPSRGETRRRKTNTHAQLVCTNTGGATVASENQDKTTTGHSVSNLSNTPAKQARSSVAFSDCQPGGDTRSGSLSSSSRGAEPNSGTKLNTEKSPPPTGHESIRLEGDQLQLVIDLGRADDCPPPPANEDGQLAVTSSPTSTTKTTGLGRQRSRKAKSSGQSNQFSSKSHSSSFRGGLAGYLVSKLSNLTNLGGSSSGAMSTPSSPAVGSASARDSSVGKRHAATTSSTTCPSTPSSGPLARPHRKLLNSSSGGGGGGGGGGCDKSSCSSGLRGGDNNHNTPSRDLVAATGKLDKHHQSVGKANSHSGNFNGPLHSNHSNHSHFAAASQQHASLFDQTMAAIAQTSRDYAGCDFILLLESNKLSHSSAGAGGGTAGGAGTQIGQSGGGGGGGGPGGGGGSDSSGLAAGSASAADHAGASLSSGPAGRFVSSSGPSTLIIHLVAPNLQEKAAWMSDISQVLEKAHTAIDHGPRTGPEGGGAARQSSAPNWADRRRVLPPPARNEWNSPSAARVHDESSNRQTDSLYSPRVPPVRLQAAAVASVPRRARKSIGREEFISAAAAAASQWPVATHADAGRRVARSRALKCDTRRGGRPANLVQHRPAVLRFAGMRPSPHTPSRQGRRIRTQWHTMAPAGAIL